MTKNPDLKLKFDNQHFINNHWSLNPIFVTPIRFKKPCFQNCKCDFEEKNSYISKQNLQIELLILKTWFFESYGSHEYGV